MRRSELAIRTWQELCDASPSRRLIRLVLIDISTETLEEHKPNLQKLLTPTLTVMDFNIGCALYFASRGVGRLAHPDGTVGELFRFAASDFGVLLSTTHAHTHHVGTWISSNFVPGRELGWFCSVPGRTNSVGVTNVT